MTQIRAGPEKTGKTAYLKNRRKEATVKEFWHLIQAIWAFLGGWLGFYLGGVDGLVYTLLVFVVLDYLTGIMRAIADKNLSSSISAKGLMRKALIFMLVGVGNILDVYVLRQGAILRTAVIFLSMSNEGLSLLENASYLGVPIPEQLRNVLVQLHARGDGGK